MEGQTVSHYRILEKIGQGGMGEVYLAEDTSLEREVALKFLHSGLQADPVAHKRFIREAKSAAAIEHPYICNIKEVAQTDDGQDFIVMEYVEGKTLKDRLEEGQIPIKEALEIGSEVAEALEQAHNKGVVHRDLKPSNIMLTSGGHVKVMDFGLAKKVVDEDGTEQDITSALTREGTTLGTIAYMSPEQLRGKTVNTRSDIFSFGIVLYELLSGVHPFLKPKQVETTNAILSEDPTPLKRYIEDTADLLQHTVDKMLEKDPEDRYQTVHEVRSNLKKLSEKLSAPDVVPAAARTNWGIWLGAGALVVLLATVALSLYYFSQGPASTEAPIDSIAVLPFTSASEDEDSASLADGIPTSISSSLSRLAQLRVKSSSILQRYRGKDVDPQTVSQEQSVRGVLLGKVERRADTLSVTVELMDGRDSTLIWSQRYARDFSDIFAVEADIARQVAEALRVQLTREQRASLAETGTNNPEAYQALLKARYFYERGWVGTADFKTVQQTIINYLEQAIEKDPQYQEAYGWLAGRYFHIARQYTNSDEDYAKARAYWEQLIQVDDSTAIAHRTKANLLWSYDRQWEEAEKEYRRAAELMPGGKNYRVLGFLAWMGRREELLDHVERDLESSDPLSASSQAGLGWTFLFLREYEKAVSQAEKVLVLEPESITAHTLLMFCYEKKGMAKEAFESFLKSDHVSGANQEELAVLQDAFARSGMEGLWRWDLDRFLRKMDPKVVDVANLYAKLGDKDQAFAWLEKAWSKPRWGDEDAPSCFWWDPLRDDPRFEELLRKLNLPEEAIQRHLALPST